MLSSVNSILFMYIFSSKMGAVLACKLAALIDSLGPSGVKIQRSFFAAGFIFAEQRNCRLTTFAGFASSVKRYSQ
jgi:hypothetical protein